MRLLPLAFRLLLQEARRSSGRYLLLALAVSIGSSSIFLTLVISHSIRRGLESSLNRLGADLLILPKGITHNLTAALLTGEPNAPLLDPSALTQIITLPGLEKISPQRHFSIPSDQGHGETDLIAFDPLTDFTLQPWVREHLPRPFSLGDVLIGGRRSEPLGSTISFFGKNLVVWGKLDLTGVGPTERSLFGSFSTMEELAQECRSRGLQSFGTSPLTGSASALLLRLSPGAGAGQVRFALSSVPQVQIISGSSLGIQIRQSIRTILTGSITFTLLSLFMAGLLILVVYAGIVAERKSELGLLLALGLSRIGLSLWLAMEAALCAFLGALFGVLLGATGLAIFVRTFGYLLTSRGITLELPSFSFQVFSALLSLFLCSCVAGLGALLPSWRLAGRELYQLLRENNE
ncbi:MAG: ABC transporter permease [Verrucomicrobia bacterium]|nr:ABC transporter permease [Verrucomicrobiota bacterium]